MWNNVKNRFQTQMQQWPTVSAWISAHRRPVISGGIIFFTLLLLLLTIRSCTSTPTTVASVPGGGYFFWKLVFMGLIIAAITSKDKPYLAWTFSGLAALIFLVLLGKLDVLFTWEVLGLPFLAAAGIYGFQKTTDRTRSFLGFALGTIISIWLFLIAKKLLSIDPTFLGERYSNDELFLLGLVALVMIAIATWKKSAILFFAFLFIAGCWLGVDFFTTMLNRSPISNPIPAPIQSGAKAITEGFGKAMERFGEQLKNPPKIQPPPGENLTGEEKQYKYIFAYSHNFNDGGENKERPQYKLDPAKEYVITGKTEISYNNGISWQSTSKPFHVPTGVIPYIRNGYHEMVIVYEVIPL